MFMPLASSAASADDGGASGESYGAVLLPAQEEAAPEVLAALRGIRFTGWIAPPGQKWLVVLGDPGDGVVANGRRGIIDVAAVLAGARGTALAVLVRRDRQLAIVAWRGGVEVGRYCSDPSQDPGADDEVMSDPLGAHFAGRFAEVCSRGEEAAKLTELLEEELDTESVFESERLVAVLRMLDLPSWLVAAGALPRNIPTGPRATELTHLRAGAHGFPGVMRNWFVRPVRRRLAPPPVIADPPRSDMSGFESWML